MEGNKNKMQTAILFFGWALNFGISVKTDQGINCPLCDSVHPKLGCAFCKEQIQKMMAMIS